MAAIIRQQTRVISGSQTMRLFGSKKDKQAALPEDRAADAELAFDSWDSGWDGWIASEPVIPDRTEAEPPLVQKQTKIA